MNILVITQIYPEPDDRDGYKPTRTVEYFAREWVALGHNVMVVHCQTQFPFLYYLIPDRIVNAVFGNTYALIPTLSSRKSIFRKEEGIHVHRLPMKKYIPSSAFSKMVMNKQVRKIEQLCKSKGFCPDIVAGHFVNPCLELTAKLGALFNSRTSFVFHNDFSQKSVQKYQIQKYAAQIDYIGARSTKAAEYLRKVLGLANEPFVCYSGIPNDVVDSAEKACTKHEQNKECVNFLYVGGLVAKKHVDKVINAFSAVYQEGYRLTIVGGGPEENRLKEIAKEKGLEEVIDFKGRLSRDLVFSEMKKANIFAMISENETFGMVYLEAMLQGCIVIASVDGGFDGIIHHNQNGFLCKAGDDKRLIETFTEILRSSRSKWNDIGQAAIDTAIKFSDRAVAENYLKTVIEDIKA